MEMWNSNYHIVCSLCCVWCQLLYALHFHSHTNHVRWQILGLILQMSKLVQPG